MLDTSYRTAYNDDHEAFRDTVRKVFAEHMTPYLDQHEEEGIVPRSAWKALGEAGLTVADVGGLEVVRDAEGQYLLTELELVEPSLFFRHDPESPARLVEALEHYLS